MHYVSTAGESCHKKISILDHFLEETLKMTMKNKFEGTSEIFKDNSKEMQEELKPDIKQSRVPVNNFLFSLAFLFFP